MLSLFYVVIILFAYQKANIKKKNLILVPQKCIFSVKNIKGKGINSVLFFFINLLKLKMCNMFLFLSALDIVGENPTSWNLLLLSYI